MLFEIVIQAYQQAPASLDNVIVNQCFSSLGIGGYHRLGDRDMIAQYLFRSTRQSDRRNAIAAYRIAQLIKELFQSRVTTRLYKHVVEFDITTGELRDVVLRDSPARTLECFTQFLLLCIRDVLRREPTAQRFQRCADGIDFLYAFASEGANNHSLPRAGNQLLLFKSAQSLAYRIAAHAQTLGEFCLDQMLSWMEMAVDYRLLEALIDGLAEGSLLADRGIQRVWHGWI